MVASWILVDGPNSDNKRFLHVNIIRLKNLYQGIQCRFVETVATLSFVLSHLDMLQLSPFLSHDYWIFVI